MMVNNSTAEVKRVIKSIMGRKNGAEKIKAGIIFSKVGKKLEKLAELREKNTIISRIRIGHTNPHSTPRKNW